MLCKSQHGTSDCLQLTLWFLLLQEMLQLMSGRQRQSHLSADSGARTVEATAGASAAGSPSAAAQVAPQPWANPRSLAAAAAEALLDAAEGSGSVTKSTLQPSGAHEAGPGSGAQIGHRQITELQGSTALAEDALQSGGACDGAEIACWRLMEIDMIGEQVCEQWRCALWSRLCVCCQSTYCCMLRDCSAPCSCDHS